MSKQITVKEVSEHNKPETGMYIIVENGVYDITG